MIPYANLLGEYFPKPAEVASKIIRDGWSLNNFPTIKLNEDIPWELKDQKQRSWNFHIHCLGMLESFLQAYSKENNATHFKYALDAAIDWITKNPQEPSKPCLSPFAWYDMAVGLRINRLAYLFDAAEELDLLDKTTKNILWTSIEVHAQHLADDKNISFHSNHGYYQIAGQIAAGKRFASRSETMSAAFQQGRVRFKSMLESQFGDDGVHLEHSPGYHQMIYSTLKNLFDADLIDQDEIEDLIKHIEEALSCFVFPNMRIVNFGDTDFNSLSCNQATAESRWITPEMRFWASGGKVGTPSNELIRVFQKSGYWIVRKPGDDSKALSSYSYLALNAAFHSRTHKHADDLSFVWFDHGMNILVDSGRYGYIGKTEKGSDLWLDGHWYSDPWRIYCESTRAHNTLEFDNRNFPRKDVPPYGSALKRWGEDCSGLTFVEAECTHFSSIRHARMLFFLPGKWLIVFDRFDDNANKPHSTKQWFHIGSEISLTKEHGVYLGSTANKQKTLKISSLLSGPSPSRPYIGEKEPEIQGWWSPKVQEVVPNHAFFHELAGESNGTFATLFTFSEHLVIDHNQSEVSASGRKGHFRWQDDQGMHELLFERPVQGDLSVTYSAGAR